MSVRFGELADYVYCTYCAALLLERMDRDRKDRLGGNRPSDVLSLFTPKWRCADAASEDHCQEEGRRKRKRKRQTKKRKLKRKVREQEAEKDKLYTCEITKRKSMRTHENQQYLEKKFSLLERPHRPQRTILQGITLRRSLKHVRSRGTMVGFG